VQALDSSMPTSSQLLGLQKFSSGSQVPVSCKQAACVTLAMRPLLNSSVWSSHRVQCDMVAMVMSSIAQAESLALQT